MSDEFKPEQEMECHSSGREISKPNPQEEKDPHLEDDIKWLLKPSQMNTDQPTCPTCKTPLPKGWNWEGHKCPENTDQPTPQDIQINGECPKCHGYPLCVCPTPQPEPAKDEWRAGKIIFFGFRDYFVEILAGENLKFKIHAIGEQESEALAKQMVEDHRRIAFLEAAADCGASGWSETLKKFKESIDEIKKLRAELEAMREKLHWLNGPCGETLAHKAYCETWSGHRLAKCTCGLSALTADRAN